MIARSQKCFSQWLHKMTDSEKASLRKGVYLKISFFYSQQLSIAVRKDTASLNDSCLIIRYSKQQKINSTFFGELVTKGEIVLAQK